MTAPDDRKKDLSSAGEVSEQKKAAEPTPASTSSIFDVDDNMVSVSMMI